jgi:hypothetical protein
MYGVAVEDLAVSSSVNIELLRPKSQETKAEPTDLHPISHPSTSILIGYV